jgi:hypothetical protein
MDHYIAFDIDSKKTIGYEEGSSLTKGHDNSVTVRSQSDPVSPDYLSDHLYTPLCIGIVALEVHLQPVSRNSWVKFPSRTVDCRPQVHWRIPVVFCRFAD